ncbi:pyruvate, water dikinase, partial [Massilia arenosa]
DVARSWTGTAIGAGRVEARCWVARTPGEGFGMEQGDILVVPATDPAWTPLFLKAGALVMETGGYLSHGAIVAREFGIPAVINVQGILDQVASGDRIVVDGHQGTVSLLRAETVERAANSR